MRHARHAFELFSSAVLSITLAATPASAGDVGDPMRGLTADQLQRFLDGRTAFEKVETPEEGLGPVFNGTSCAGCHSVGASGGGSEVVETRFGTTTAGAFDPLTQFGGSLIQTTGIGAAGACTFEGEVVPPEATIVAGRRTTPLFGLGLVDALPDDELLALARKQARYTPAIAGRPSIVTNVVTGKPDVGKFGWKAQVPSLFVFSGDAYLNEMGITTPLFPNENCPNGDCDALACDPLPGVDDDLDDVEAFRDFMTLLAPPRPLSGTWETLDGSRLFDKIGCSGCHVRTLTTGPSEFAPIANRSFQPYSDFLLHDMGALGDGIAQNGAGGREMRTAPLWGSRLFTTYLHDGRARTLEAAIAAHDGEGRGARDRYLALRWDLRGKVIAFLKTL